MGWDIYGEPLRRGHCEVHPHVHEEYPCSVCISENQARVQDQYGCRGGCESEHYLGLAQEEIERLNQTIKEVEADIRRLLQVLDEGRRAIGDHCVPDDCYATGPATGDPYRDLLQCPACSFIAMYDDTTAAYRKKGGW